MHPSRRESDLKIRHHQSSANLLRAQADAACEQLKRTNDSAEKRRLDELCQRLHHEAAVIEKAALYHQHRIGAEDYYGKPVALPGTARKYVRRGDGNSH